MHCRHFLSTDMLKAVIDLLAQNKFNVFHWHIVDSESFPYASKSVPELAKGAFSPKHQYSIQDIKDIVEFGRLHGIRILPEIDTPGHVASWGRGVPKLLARCFDDNGTETFDRNIFDVTQDAVLWDVLDALFKEVFELFPEKFVHLGADEAAFWTRECWENNPNISTFMQRYNINTTDELQQWYLTKLLSLLRNQKEGKKKKYIIWQELFDYGRAPEDVIVQVWKGSTPHTQMESIKNVTGAGHFALLSSCWYLDVQRGSVDWSQHYNCDPTSFVGSVVQKKLVLGGEAALWGEWVDESNLIPRLFPRASAVAERLWSFIEEPIEINKVWPRLYEMQCRMAARGFPAEPGNGPGFCENEYKAKLPWL
ncbi:hypothetical protein AB6A40_009399 [Gnathostoma spinigerum]|uniref:beta-N-acetylhexosaminidase n=1 Tax=Gnathostoma spinigerum TaxID=75299 RepID=A0ABD6ET36_9BILA